MSPRAPVGGVTEAGGVWVVVGCGIVAIPEGGEHPLKEITSNAPKDLGSE